MERLGIVEEAAERRAKYGRYAYRPPAMAEAGIIAGLEVARLKRDVANLKVEVAGKELQLGQLRNENKKLRRELSVILPGIPHASSAAAVIEQFLSLMNAGDGELKWDKDLLHTPRRSRVISHPRMICIALVRQLVPILSYPQIGKIFHIDHTSALHAVRRAPELVSTDPALAHIWATVIAHFTSEQSE